MASKILGICSSMLILIGMVRARDISSAVLGRAEAFAIANPVGPSLLDAFGNGIGYAWVLLVIALVREVLGTGKIVFTTLARADITIFPPALTAAMDGQYPLVLILPPGAFLVLGLLIWVVKAAQGTSEEA